MPYPPPVYAPAMPADLASAPPASLLGWFFSIAALGLPAGVLWWVTAPAGAFYGAGADAQAWLPRDLVLGLIGVVFGLAIGVAVLRVRYSPAMMAKAAAALGGCVAASVLAWQTGQFTAALFTGPPQEPVTEGAQFALLSYGVLPLWPGSAALVVFVWALLSLLRRGTR